KKNKITSRRCPARAVIHKESGISDARDQMRRRNCHQQRRRKAHASIPEAEKRPMRKPSTSPGPWPDRRPNDRKSAASKSKLHTDHDWTVRISPSPATEPPPEC